MEGAVTYSTDDVQIKAFSKMSNPEVDLLKDLKHTRSNAALSAELIKS